MWIGIFISAIGAYFIASTIARMGAKEKIPHKKLIGFLFVFGLIFTLSFIVLCIMAVIVGLVPFGR